MKKIIIALTFICIFVCEANATPAISTGGVNEEAFTLSGSGFGIKTTAPPLKWETFESGTEGALLSTGGYWSNRPKNKASFFAEPRGTSSLAARQQQVGDETEDWFYRNNVLTDSDEKGLIIFWCKTVVATWDITDTWQQKMWVVIYDGANYLGDSNAPALYTAPQYNTNSIYDYATLVYNDAFQGQETMNGNDLYNTTGGWQMTAVEWQRSSIDGNDAVMYRYLSDSVGTLAINKITKTGFNTRTTAVNRNLLSFQFGLMNTNSDELADVTMYYDDIYIDNSWARVEIGDNAVYANCAHREIQPAATWSDTSITGTFNRGSFNNGDTVYFFVIDENGIPSAGYPVTIGGEPVIANPIVEILTESGQTTTASVFAITGTATADTDQTISGVTCSGQTVTPDDGTWDEQSEAFTCLASLALGENTLVFIGSDGTRIGSDSVAVTRTAAQQASITNTSISHGVLRH